jgi:hypothetical protein
VGSVGKFGPNGLRTLHAPCLTGCRPAIDVYDPLMDEPDGRRRTGENRMDLLRNVRGFRHANIPFGPLVLVITGLLFLAIQFPGSPPHAYLAGTDPAISVSGTVLRTKIQFTCFDDLAKKTQGSPQCSGVLIKVTASSDRHEIPIGTSLAVGTPGSYKIGDVFLGSTPRSSPQNALGTILILGLILLACGIAGASVDVLRRRNRARRLDP